MPNGAEIQKISRKDFLLTYVWGKSLRPLLIISGLVYLLWFFIKALEEGSNERQFINFIGFIFIIGGLMITLALLSEFLRKLIDVNMPLNLRVFYGRNKKAIRLTLNITAIAIVAYFILMAFFNERYSSLIMAGVLLFLRILSDKMDETQDRDSETTSNKNQK